MAELFEEFCFVEYYNQSREWFPRATRGENRAVMVENVVNEPELHYLFIGQTGCYHNIIEKRM